MLDTTPQSFWHTNGLSAEAALEMTLLFAAMDTCCEACGRQELICEDDITELEMLSAARFRNVSNLDPRKKS